MRIASGSAETFNNLFGTTHFLKYSLWEMLFSLAELIIMHLKLVYTNERGVLERYVMQITSFLLLKVLNSKRNLIRKFTSCRTGQQNGKFL